MYVCMYVHRYVHSYVDMYIHMCVACILSKYVRLISYVYTWYFVCRAVDPLAPPTTQQEEMMLEGGMRTVHVQTDNRDSETQTEPYAPQYVVKPGEQPELLALASLSWGACVSVCVCVCVCVCV